MVPETGTRFCDRPLQRGHQCWRDCSSAYCAVDCDALRVAMGVSSYRRYWIHVARVMASAVSATRAASATLRGRTCLHSKRRHGNHSEGSVVASSAAPSNLGNSYWEVPDRSDLVVLPLLAAEISERQARSEFEYDRRTAGCDLCHSRRGKHRGWMAFIAPHQTRMERQSSAQDDYADLRGLCSAHCIRLAGFESLVRGSADRAGRRRASGL